MQHNRPSPERAKQPCGMTPAHPLVTPFQG
jgi:hypothetical protein